MQDKSSSSSKNRKINDAAYKKNDWRGTSISEILGDDSPWHQYTPPINRSSEHTVLFEQPISLIEPPKPFNNEEDDSDYCHWNDDHVKMPFSPNNLGTVKESKVTEKTWDIIRSSLLKPISTSAQLEEAIFSYNPQYSKFKTLHYFFKKVLDKKASQSFFKELLPKIIKLALKLPELFPSQIPLLKQHKAHAISLSQFQIASLLANAFLCTFPSGEETSLYPGINFNKLYESNRRQAAIVQKLKCLINYFQRVCDKAPVSVVTFERKYISAKELPQWDKIDDCIANIKLHITSSGTIEDDGLGLLQVDFADRNVGGQVLYWGCAQEEIRFVTCPELIVCRLFTARLENTEALQIIGAERFNKYKGYFMSFEWSGNYDDKTPFDAHGRRRTNVVAIDATHYYKPAVQFTPLYLTREINKAYVGFHEKTEPNVKLSAVATGNWGCGVFRGNVYLKSLLQIMACTVAKRDVAYYTFKNEKTRDAIYKMYNFLVEHQVKVSELWEYLCQYDEDQLPTKNIYKYIQGAHLSSLETVSSFDKSEDEDETEKKSSIKKRSPKRKRNKEESKKSRKQSKKAKYSSNEDD